MDDRTYFEIIKAAFAAGVIRDAGENPGGGWVPRYVGEGVVIHGGRTYGVRGRPNAKAGLFSVTVRLPVVTTPEGETHSRER